MNIYEQRQYEQRLRDMYRVAARRLFPNTNVSITAFVAPAEGGAFVEVTVWVPRPEAEKEFE